MQYSKEEIELAKKIREFEIKVLKAYGKELKHSVHCGVGIELETVHIIKQLREDDYIFGNHRSHVHFLSRYSTDDDFESLWQELQGSKLGVNQGKALSQHIKKDRYFSWGIQGSLVPVATGVAMGTKLRGEDSVVVVFIGDGTTSMGTVWESCNMIALWQLPVVIVVQNNMYAMSTPVSEGVANWEHLRDRFEAFGLKEADYDNIRENTPSFCIRKSWRFCGHSGSDQNVYRDPKVQAEMKSKDNLGGYLLDDPIFER